MFNPFFTTQPAHPLEELTDAGLVKFYEEPSKFWRIYRGSAFL